ncbi:MAG: 4Fe-4S dicluster domain-containing protein [Planctomycetaceae bacterium]|jgi:ferredoxin|nr:4Fe-4S dicluster domain-containing protein [Planctomycetaceae bacterium]
MNVPKYVRAAVAFCCFAAVVLFFLDFTQTLPDALHRLADIQFVPLLVSGSLIFICVYLAVTLLFGRIYCSVICPLGVMQDIFSRLGKIRNKKRSAFKYRKESSVLRNIFFILFLIGLADFPVFVTLLDPYSNFGRIMTAVFLPVIVSANNFVTEITDSGFLRFHSLNTALPAVVLAAAVFVFVAALSFFRGRRYCNIICPVGTLLGFLSRFSFFRIRIQSGCVSCGLCEKACKGECIDSKAKTVDASRCVMCFNCLGVCKKNSIAFTTGIRVHPLPSAKTDVSVPAPTAVIPVQASALPLRRTFLQWFLVSLGLPAIFGSAKRAGAAANTADAAAGLPTGVSKIGYKMSFPVLPPGASSFGRFRRHCTGCLLCVTKCPANIIVPSGTELGLAGFMQPIIKFANGFCNYDCTICSRICPTHALKGLKVDEKHATQIGRVVFLKENCVVPNQETNCGACAEHCPTGAVKMQPYGDPQKSLTIPVIDPDLCVGCGACEHICPVKPFRAIYVDGLKQHGQAKPAYDPNEKQKEEKLEDFGF